MPNILGVFSVFGVKMTPKTEKTQSFSPHGARSALVRDAGIQLNGYKKERLRPLFFVGTLAIRRA